MTVLTDAFCHILVVGPDQCVTEIPRMLLKHTVVCLEADGLQILDSEDGGGTGVALAEGVCLPDAGDEA